MFTMSLIRKTCPQRCVSLDHHSTLYLSLGGCSCFASLCSPSCSASDEDEKCRKEKKATFFRICLLWQTESKLSHTSTGSKGKRKTKPFFPQLNKVLRSSSYAEKRTNCSIKRPVFKTSCIFLKRSEKKYRTQSNVHISEISSAFVAHTSSGLQTIIPK